MKFKSTDRAPRHTKPGNHPLQLQPLAFLAITEDGDLVRLTSNDHDCLRLKAVQVYVDDSQIPTATPWQTYPVDRGLCPLLDSEGSPHARLSHPSRGPSVTGP